MMWTFVFFVLVYLKVPAESLNNLRAHIPDTVIRGHNAVFNCTFNFDEDETLYAIKWYRGTYEIFRYIPSDDPPTKRFPLAGYNVSMIHSTGTTMVLNKVDFVNTGAYSCEVIADLTFHTLIETNYMTVVDLPEGTPTITGVSDGGKVKVGETITAICTSWQSNPPANLSWFINGEPARSGYTEHGLKLRQERDGTFTSVLQLSFPIANYHFIDGKIKLKCTSSMLSVYWQSREVKLEESKPHSNQISDLIKNSKDKNRRNRNRIKDGKQKPSRPAFPSNGNLNKKPKTDDSTSDATGRRESASNNNNNKVEGLTHHVLSSSTKAASASKFSYILSSVILMFIVKILSIPHFVVRRYPNLSEYLFWIFAISYPVLHSINSI